MKKIFAFAKPYLKPFRGAVAVLILLYIIAGLAALVQPYLFGSFVDALLNGSAASRMASYVLLIAGLGTVELVLGCVCERLYIRVQCRSGHALNVDAIHRIQNMPFRFMRDRNASFLNRQINGDANAVVIFCITVLENILTNVLSLLLPLVLIARMEPWLGLAVLAVNLLYFALYHLLKGRLYRAQRKFMDEQADYFSKLGTQLSNVKFIQTHGLAEGYIKRLRRSLEKLLHFAFKAQKAQYAFTGSDVVIKYGATILVFLLGGYAVIRGKMTLGDFTIVQSFFAMTLGATQYFFSLGKEIQSTRVSCDRLQAIFDEPEQTNGVGKPEDIRRIECRGVSFRYGDDNVLSDRNEVFEKGNIYAFVGENGAGKSTFINLLLGLFIDQYEGTVCYDGVPIEKLDMRTVRHDLIGVSEQEPMLLEDTLRFNLTFDDQAEVEEAEFQALCELLNLDAFVRQLPNGLDTVVREGSTNLSGGEKQKISLIRALLKHPKLLVLDEPTSALDRESARKLIDYLSGIRDDMIVFISTHDEKLLSICSETTFLSKK
ncbi:MAG: ABC transporter ATP-binding protein [Oscillospiraceae bacterium]|nr:ABC transporter ATP-binding protein [Oscillospiraceae bacterium]